MHVAAARRAATAFLRRWFSISFSAHQRAFRHRAIWGVMLFCGAFSPPASAAVRAFDVPAQNAADALLAFAHQAGVELLFPFEELRSVESSEVRGTMEVETALNRLLLHTGFYARHAADNKFLVNRLANATGAIAGRLLGPTGAPASGVRVSTSDGHHYSDTGEDGAFQLDRLEPGTYQLNIYGRDYRPLEIVDLRVAADRVLNVETQRLQSADDEPIRLAPQIVEGRFFRRWKNRGKVDFHPQEAAGNLDLPRTENDALPYTIFDHEQIARSGVVNLNDFLQRNVLDAAASNRAPDQQPGSDRGPSGTVLVASSSNLQLRGYTAEETAILVNGRRLPEVFTSGNQTPAQPPDVNFIPLSLVERVEVLPISSSALYTGNPVGGVINIVLRPDVNVTEVNTTYTNALGKFDAPQSTISLQHGETLLGGKLRVRLNASFTQTTPANESELGFIQANLRGATISAADLHRATPNVVSQDGSPLFGPGSASFSSVAPGADGSNPTDAFAGRDGVRSTALFNTPGGLANSSDSLDYAYGRRQRGTNYFASAVYDLTPWLQVGVDGIYNRSVINRGYNVFAGNLTLAPHSASSPFNPFDQAIDVSLNETVPALGQSFAEGRIDFYAAVLGLLVKLPSDWRVSLDSQYGHSVTRYRGIAGVDAEKWQQLVDEGRYNPLRDTQVYGPPPAFYDEALIYYGGKGQFVTIGDYQTLDTAIRVTNQSVPFPTGSGAVNFGGDYRVNRLGGYTAERRYGNGDYAEDPVRWKGRMIERVSIFGELQAPLLPSNWLPPWIRDVETDLAARYVAAATSQETNVAPTAALKLDFAGGFALRGSVATANRFPPPYMSSRGATAAGPGGGDVTVLTIFDPRRNESYSGVLSSTAINPSLRVEANVTRAAGLVYEHGKVHRVRVALDFSDTRKSGEQVTLNENSVLKLESSFPDRVKRAPLDPADTSHTVGRVTSLLTGPVNLAWRESRNWTTGLDYAWTECLGGRLDVYGRWSYFSKYAIKLLPDDPTIDELNHPDGAVSVLKHRVNFGASWSKKDFGLGFDGHYYHSRKLPVEDWALQHRRQINPYWEFDTFVQTDLTRWLPGKFTRFSLHGQLRVNNILDARPPRYANDPSQAGVQSYGDWRGRTYAVSLNATF